MTASQDVMIMAAPNGSRWTKEDHPALPVSIEEIVEETTRCHKAGAAIMHVHVRDLDGLHVLDAGLYKELIGEITRATPDTLIQITTEAVGRYSPEEQRAVVSEVMPEMVSIALKEMIPTKDCEEDARSFYAWASEAQIHVQHILYSREDIIYYNHLTSRKIIPDTPTAALYVLGRYSDSLTAGPEELSPLLEVAEASNKPWFCCAFGPAENACMKKSFEAGGHARVGFENNFKLANGATAANTAEIVKQTVSSAEQLGKRAATSTIARKLLWQKTNPSAPA